VFRELCSDFRKLLQGGFQVVSELLGEDVWSWQRISIGETLVLDPE
jgi:hypothetical protein